MKRAVSVVALAIVIAACGRAGGVADTPPAPVATASTAAPTVTTKSSADVTEVSAVSEADVSELEAVLDEIDELVLNTETLIDEPLP